MDILIKSLTQETGVAWYPLYLLFILIITFIIITIWGNFRFRKDYNENSDQVKPFNSGNVEEINYNVKAANIYWGFKNAFKPFYNVMKGLHSGDLNEYLVWFVISLAVCLILLSGVVI